MPGSERLPCAGTVGDSRGQRWDSAGLPANRPQSGPDPAPQGPALPGWLRGAGGSGTARWCRHGELSHLELLMPRGERCHPAGSGAGAVPGSGGCEPCTRVCTGVRTRAAPTPRPRLWVQEGFCCPRSREKMWVRCRGVPSATPATPPWLAMGCWTLPSLHSGHGVLSTLSPVRAAPSSLPAPTAVTNPPEGSTGKAGGMQTLCIPALRAPLPCLSPWPPAPPARGGRAAHLGSPG